MGPVGSGLSRRIIGGTTKMIESMKELLQYAPHFLFIMLGFGAGLLFLWGGWEFYQDVVEWRRR